MHIFTIRPKGAIPLERSALEIRGREVAAIFDGNTYLLKVCDSEEEAVEHVEKLILCTWGRSSHDYDRRRTDSV